MRNNTTVLIAALAMSLAYVGSASSADDAQEEPTQRERVKQDDTTVTVTTDILVNRTFTDQDAERARTDATARGEDPAQAVERARRAQIEQRCNLWLVYLAQQNNRSEQVGINRDTMKCEESVRSGSDGKTRSGTLSVEVTVPRGRKVVEARRVDFRNAERYESWVQCHRAAAQITQAVVAICDEAVKKDNGQYLTSLRVFQFARQ